MLAVLFLVLIILWFLGYVRIEGFMIPDFALFSINAHTVTLWNLLILIFVSWALSIIPTPIRQIIAVLLILWILTVLGIIVIGGIDLDNILVLTIIIGVIVSLLRPADSV